MKRVTDPPKLPGIAFQNIVGEVESTEVGDFIRRANADYLYWDDLKRKVPPTKMTPTQAWWTVRFSRLLNRKPLPLCDESGQYFSYWLPDSLAEVLKSIDQGAAGNFLATSQSEVLLGETARQRIVIKSLMDEAIATSQLEGAVTTRARAREMLRTQRAPKNRDEQMIFNSYRTMNTLREIAEQPLTLNLLHKIQKVITEKTLDDPAKAGCFRTREDDIVVMDDRNHEILFVPPDADSLPERIQKLIEFANKVHSGPNFIHPLVKASILHFWLAYEHPYVDGNGRTARALFYWFMLKQKYWLFEFLTISRVVHRARAQYALSFLYSEKDSNDLTYSIHHMLKVTERAIDDLTTRLEAMHREARRMNDAVKRYSGLNPRQRALLGYAVSHKDETFTIIGHQTSHGVTYQTARTDFLDLVRRKLFVRRKMGKKLVFFPVANLSQRLKPT